MAEGDITGRRPRRSTAVAQRLERMRQNKARLDADRRDKQQREDAALERFAEHEAAVTKREQQRDHVIAGYEEKIQRERDRAAEEVAEVRAQQAALLRELRAVDRTPTDIAALVEWPLKQVQRLLRQTPQTGARSTKPRSPEKAVDQQQVGERREPLTGQSLAEADGHAGSLAVSRADPGHDGVR